MKQNLLNFRFVVLIQFRWTIWKRFDHVQKQLQHAFNSLTENSWQRVKVNCKNGSVKMLPQEQKIIEFGFV